MAKTYAELSREIELLTAQALAVRQKEKAGVIERIRDAIAVYDLTADDLGLGHKPTKTTGSREGDPKSKTAGPLLDKAPVAKRTSLARYRDDLGNAWGGRGPKPNWLKEGLATGRSLESFATSRLETDAAPPPHKSAQTTEVTARAKKNPPARKAFKSAIRYRDSDGHTWSGRGPQPAWFALALENGMTPEQLTV